MKNKKSKEIQLDKRKIFKWSGIGSAALIVIVLFLILLFKGIENNFVVYVKNEELFFSGLSGKDSWQVTKDFMGANENEDDMIETAVSSVADYIQVSKDGKAIFFINRMQDSTNGHTIWYRETGDKKAEAVKIDTNITMYRIGDSGDVVNYIKGNALYQSNLKDKEKIESDIKDFRASKDGKTIIYMDSDYEVYWKEFDKESKKIASDVTGILYMTEDGMTVYYTKEDGLYKKEVKGDEVKLFTDIYRVVKIYETGEIYYLEEKSVELSLEEYVIDDMKEKDAQLVEPEFPSAINYNTDEEYLAAYDAYEKQMGDVYDKEFRDEFRRDLNSMKVEHITYNLCYFDGTNKKQVLENVVDDTEMTDSKCAEEKPTLLASVYVAEEIEKVKISEAVSVDALKETVTNKLNGSKEWYVVDRAKPSKIKQEGGTGFLLSKEGDRVIFVNEFSSKTQQGELYEAKVTKKGLGTLEKYDDDVCYALFMDDGKLVYYKDINKEGQKATLYVEGKKVADKVDVGSATSVADTGVLIYIKDWDYEDDNGALHMYNGKKSKIVAKNIHRFEVLPNGKVIYLKDFSSKTYSGDLYVWNTRKNKKIDEEVQTIVPVQRRED